MTSQKTDVSLKVEKYISFIMKLDCENLIDGHYFVNDEFEYNVISYLTKKYDDACYESHDKHIDVQLLISGTEKMFIRDRSFFNDSPNICEQKEDVLLYFEKPNCSPYMIMTPGSVVVLFPNDCHLGGVSVDGECCVKKIVGKIKI